MSETPDPVELAGISELIDLGELDEALERLSELAGPRDFGVCPAPIPAMAATVLLAGEAFDDAAEVLAQALGLAPTDADLLTVRAELHAARWAIDAAAADAQAAIAIDAEIPQAHRVLGVCADVRGDRAAADRHHATARRLDPDSYPAGVTCTEAEFDAEVERTLAELRTDPKLAAVLEPVAIVVEDLPGEAIRALPGCSPDLLGLFPADEAPVPNTLYLFRRNIARSCDDRAELADEIRTTVLHELGHLLGFDEDGLADLGLD